MVVGTGLHFLIEGEQHHIVVSPYLSGGGEVSAGGLGDRCAWPDDQVGVKQPLFTLLGSKLSFLALSPTFSLLDLFILRLALHKFALSNLLRLVNRILECLFESLHILLLAQHIL